MLEQIEFGMAGLADSGLQLEGLELAAQDVDSAEDLAVVSEHRESADIPEMTDTPEPAEALAEARNARRAAEEVEVDLALSHHSFPLCHYVTLPHFPLCISRGILPLNSTPP